MFTFYIFGVLCAALIFGDLLLNIFSNKRVQVIFNIILLFFIGIIILYAYYNNSYSSILGLFSFNPFSEFFILLFTVGVALINLLYFSFAEDYRELSMLLSFSLIGMYIVALSNSLTGIFIGLELMSIPTVFSILLSKKSLEAATKLFILAAISIAIFSFAMAITYGGLGTLSLIKSQYSNIMLVAFVLFVVSLGFEASIFPFNVLVPDIYEGSPGYITALLGGVNKKVGFAALIQVLILIFIAYHSAFIVIAILSVFTMFYGNIGALMQKNLKRLMAYSSIAQAGYILIGIATASVYGMSGALFQIFAHVFIFIGLLAIIATLERKNMTTIDSIAGLKDKNPFMAFAMVLFMLSLVGLPLTTGFVGKILIFLGAIYAGLAILAVLGVLNSMISLYYYLKIITSIYSKDTLKKHVNVDKYTLSVVVICLAVTILFGIFPQPILNMINSAATYLFSL